MKKPRDGLWWGFGALMTLSGVVVLMTADLGYVYRTEFSPDKLVFRSSNYYFYEFLSMPSEFSNPVLERIREFDDGRVAPNSAPRWHFVHGDKPGFRGWHGNAKNVSRALRDYDWIEWTDNHPDLAKHLWPKIIGLLRQERYYQVRTVAMLAHDAKTTADLDRAFAEAEKD